jgi:hypothetical protein
LATPDGAGMLSFWNHNSILLWTATGRVARLCVEAHPQPQETPMVTHALFAYIHVKNAGEAIAFINPSLVQQRNSGWLNPAAASAMPSWTLARRR